VRFAFRGVLTHAYLPRPKDILCGFASSKIFGTPGDTAPEALLSVLRAEETRRKSLEDQLAILPQSPAVVSIDCDRVARELRTRADDMQGVLRRQGVHAREVLQTLLVDRVDCTPVLVAGARGYAFTGDGTFGGPLAAGTWPTTFGGPNGICYLVGQLLRFPLKGTALRTQHTPHPPSRRWI
jgi:hypothetical protein